LTSRNGGLEKLVEANRSTQHPPPDQ